MLNVCIYILFFKRNSFTFIVKFSKKMSVLLLDYYFPIRERTLKAWEGGWRGFTWAIKYFRHILMGHEIF